MQTMTIERGPVIFPAGCLLKLSDEQIRRRRRLIEPSGADGVFRAKAPVQFKTGETVDTDVAIPKSMADRVSLSGGKPKPAKSKRRSDE